MRVCVYKEQDVCVHETANKQKSDEETCIEQQSVLTFQEH